MRVILVVGHRWPDPEASAAGSRMLSLLRTFVGQGWRVSFACAAERRGAGPDLPALGVAEQAVELNAESFERYLQALRPDLVLFDRFMTEEQYGWRVAKACPQALRVLDTEDLHSLRLARRLAAGPPASGGQGPLQARQCRQAMAATDTAKREIAAIFRCDLSLIVSEFEHRLLVEEFSLPPELLHYCPLLAEREFEPGPDFHRREGFVCIGNFLHQPNLDAVHWLGEAIWPAIRRRLGAVSLDIYGAYSEPRVASLSRPADGFNLRGWAPDLRAVMHAARVCLAPLRFGAGLKGKLLEAMLYGTPSVTTPIGAEGLCEDGDGGAARAWPGAVADSCQAIAEAAAALYTDRRRWQRARALGGDLALRRFARRHHAPALVERLERAWSELGAARARNFIGAMLRHHQHHSSRYLGRWIEAKNRRAGEPAPRR